MKVESFKDKFVISESELQEIIKKHILNELGREVYGDIKFQQRNAGSDVCYTAYGNLADGPKLL